MEIGLSLSLTSPKGVGVIFDFTIIALGRVIGPNTRFIDTRV